MENKKKRTYLGDIYATVLKAKSYKNFRQDVKTLINRIYPEATPQEKFGVYKACLELKAKGDTYEVFTNLVKSENTVLRNISTRATRKGLKDMLGTSRKLEEPRIFYLCSSHPKPASDHKDYQGKIYVDRFYRAVLSRRGISDGTIPQVENYVKANGIKTVQWVTHGPVYMTTRPNCKHFFVPVPTSQVLKLSTVQVKELHPEALMTDKVKKMDIKLKRKLVKKTLLKIGYSK